jgi:hypothetical protein
MSLCGLDENVPVKALLLAITAMLNRFGFRLKL